MTKKIAAYVGGFSLAGLVAASQSYAVGNAAAGSAISTASGELVDTAEAALPLVLIVTVVMVVITLAKRLLRKAA